jgi:hypothetical protein
MGRTENNEKRKPARSQRETVRDALLGAAQCDHWLTLRELSALTRYGEASISAQLRHLRKPRYGAFVVEKQVRKDADALLSSRVAAHGAVWEYRLFRNRDNADWLGELLRELTAAAAASPG